MTTTYLPDLAVTKIRAHGNNPRRDTGDITELAASIAALGLLEPLVVAPINGVEFQLIAGHRRLKAAKAAGLKVVPAMLREDLDTPPKQLQAMLVENTQRTDLSAVEEAAAYQQLLAFPGQTITKASKATGRSARTIKARLALTTLPEKTQTRVHDGSITLADAEVLAEFVDADPNVYANLVAQVGTSNFAWTVTRIRESQAIAAALVAVEKWCADHGYETATVAPPRSSAVLSSWSIPKGLPAFLADLTDDAGYVLWKSATGQWSLHAVALHQEEEGVPTPAKWQPSAEAVAADEERTKRTADLETARQTRIAWALGRCSSLLLKPDERLAVLRLLIAEMLDTYDLADESLALAGAAAWAADADEADNAEAMHAKWAENLTENEAWRALVVLGWDLGKCGSERWPYDHKQSIRVATALGYVASDVETQLLAGDGAL